MKKWQNGIILVIWLLTALKTELHVSLHEETAE